MRVIKKMFETQAIIPIASLDKAKSRLKDLLTPSQRAELVLCMLEDISKVLLDSDDVSGVTAISPDTKALDFASSLDIQTILEPRPLGLNMALNHATKTLMKSFPNCSNLILPVDIPLLEKASLEGVFRNFRNNDVMQRENSPDKIVIAAQSNNGGTNLLLRCPADVIGLSFGPNSFSKHRKACMFKKAPFVEWNSLDTSLDIDMPEDVKKFMKFDNDTKTKKFLRTCLANDN